jgi:DNA invertase Pin-like site-specific DNA recombinase
MYPQNQRSQEEKDQILSAYHERPSMRGIARTFHISRDTLKKLLKKSERTTDSQGKFVGC